jgi:integrase
VRAIKVAENLQRQELNPIEEAIAVCQLIETVSPERVTPAEAEDVPRMADMTCGLSWGERVEKVAEYLGKPVRWVRDRAYLARLQGDARQLVIDGRLPLAHAREVAKIADDEIRDDLAHRAARKADGSGGLELAALRNSVAAQKMEDGEKVWVSLPADTVDAIRAWLAKRPEGDRPGPLFTAMDRRCRGLGMRMDGGSVWRMARRRGKAVGIDVSPHKFRHAAGTHALDVTNGDVRAVQKFLRHKRPDTVLIYDDNRRNLQGEVATAVARGR